MSAIFIFRGQEHSDWTKSLTAIWRELQAYVKAHHLTGLVWNPKVGLVVPLLNLGVHCLQVSVISYNITNCLLLQQYDQFVFVTIIHIFTES